MTSTLLKFVALIAMTIDHIGQFFPGTPIWFRWIGRISAPIFLFVFVHSLTYTSNKKGLLARLYFCNVIMIGIGICINRSDIVTTIATSFGLYENNIFGTFFAIAILILLIEQIKSKSKNWKKYLFCYILLQILSTVVTEKLVYSNMDPLALAWCQLTANIFLNEGRLFFVILGVVLYYIKDYKKNLIKYYSLTIFANSAIILTAILPKISCRIQNAILSAIFDTVIGIIGYQTVLFHEISPIYSDFGWMVLPPSLSFYYITGKKEEGISIYFMRITPFIL